MLRLFVENSEQSDAVVPVRWCVSKGILDVLKTKEVIQPYLLLSIVRDKREVQRYLSPLEQAMEFIQLHHSGQHRIRGIIIWAESKDHDRKDLRKKLLSKPNDLQFENNLYNSRGEFKPEYLGILVAGFFEEAELDVIVGSGFFAPEPPEWEKSWVNLWFEYPPRDQCEYRKRRFVAYSIQPPLVLLWTLILTVFRTSYALLSLMLGMRGVKFSPIIHPFSEQTSDVCPFAHNVGEYFTDKNSVFISDKNGKRRAWFLLFHPLVWVVVGTGLHFIHRSHEEKSATVIAIIVTVTMTFFFLACDVLVKWENFCCSEKYLEQKAERERQESVQRDLALLAFKQQQEAALQYIVCDGTPLPVKVAALPKQRQTAYLRFQDFKARVCWPFARS